MHTWRLLLTTVLIARPLAVQSRHNVSTVEDDPKIVSADAITTEQPASNVSTTSITNCTRCYVWKGDECYDYQPCTFCNQTVTCESDYLVCRDNVCMLDSYGAMGHADPLGRVIALILLTIFLLSLLTLCLRVCSNVCGARRTGIDRRCCVFHCAISVQCCCDWKTGRLRIIPDSEASHAHVVTASVPNDASPSTRRAALYPPPPPAYLEIFPPPAAAAHDDDDGEQQQQDESQDSSRVGSQRPSTGWTATGSGPRRRSWSREPATTPIWTTRQSHYLLQRLGSPSSHQSSLESSSRMSSAPGRQSRPLTT